MSDRMTAADYQEMINGKKPKKSKFRNIRTEVDGIKFDSKREADRWGILKMKEKGKLITALQRQVKYDLGEKSYIADFVYLDRENMEYIVEDAKGTKTPEYIHKRKLMKKFYNIEILET